MALQILEHKKAKQPLRKTYGTGARYDDRMRYISDSLFNKVRQMPELLSMLDTIVMDHFMGPVDFYDADGKPLGPTKLKKYKNWWYDNDVQGVAFYGQGIDYFTDGSSFGWHVSANNLLSSKQKEMIAKIKAQNPEVGVYAEEASHLPRKVSYLAASTVEIKNDNFGEIYYVQQAGGEEAVWYPEQVVHVKLMDFNGEIRGHSPLKALVKEILMMYMLKENIAAKLQNGGSPDYIISMKNAGNVSRARFERLRTALESCSHLKKSHGNMPIDAEVETHALGTDLKDMEYRELAMFIISEFALALGLPTSRVPFLMTGSGGSSNKGELSGNSEDSYQTKLNARRCAFENKWNKVFKKAGFTFKFRRDNLQDDVRETQASTQRSAYVTEVQNSLFKSKKRLKLSAHLALLSGTKMNIEEDDVEDVPEEDLMPMGPAPMAGRGGPLSPKDIDMKGKVSKDKSQAKKGTAFNNERFK
jgi:HK97 family phage portal protein